MLFVGLGIPDVNKGSGRGPPSRPPPPNVKAAAAPKIPRVTKLNNFY